MNGIDRIDRMNTMEPHHASLLSPAVVGRVRRALAAGLVMALAAGCAEQRLPTDPGAGPAFAQVELVAQIAAAGRSLTFVSGYARASSRTAIVTLDSQTVTLPAGSDATVPLRVDITSCLSDVAREAPGDAPVASQGARPVCLLHIALTLRDAGGEVIGRGGVIVPVHAGEQVDAPPVTLDAGS